MIYLNSNQPINDYNDKLEKMIYQTDSYNFCEVITVTEKNVSVIIDLLKLYQPYQFITYSLDEFDKLTPTQISELILTMTNKLDITFTTFEDNLYFDKSNYLEIYPKIFEHFKSNATVQ